MSTRRRNQSPADTMSGPVAKKTRTARTATIVTETSRNSSAETATDLDSQARTSTSDTSSGKNLNNSESSIERLTTLMASFVETTMLRQAQPFGNFMPKGDAIPTFDPKDRNQESLLWVKKVEELREVYKWSEEATIHFALGKLRGSAEVWYKGLSSVKYTWAEWKEKLCRAFPSRKDFHTSLVEMLSRKKQKDESYVAYCHEKLALLNPLKIEGIDAVSCIIGGLNDEVIAVGAKAGNHQTPESLLAYLNTLPQPEVPSYSKMKPSSSKNIVCHNCKKTGHFAKNCRASKSASSYSREEPRQNKWREPKSESKSESNSNKFEKKVCTYCNKTGHFESYCFKKRDDQKVG